MAPSINLEPVLKLPLSKRIIILAAINVAIVAAIYWFLIGPKFSEVGSLKAQLADLNLKLTESRLIAADIPKFMAQKEEMENRLKNAVAQLPNEKEIPDLIDSISSAGQKSGLKIMLFQPGPEVKKGFYAEVPVSMSVEGRYESLAEFSSKVANLPRIVNMGGLNIQSTGHKNRIPQINSTFVATTFRFIPGAEGEPKK